MKTEHIFKLYQTLNTDNLSFVYQGDFSDAITEKIVNLSEQSLEGGDMAKMKNKVSFLIVECFQNIVRHGTESNANNNNFLPGLFSTRNMDNSFYITSANLVENKNIAPLRASLEQINSLDKDQLKALYMNILSNQEMSDKGGAGLGLVEMARKSGNPIQFDFKNENDLFSFFYLMLKTDGKGTELAEGKQSLSLENSQDLPNTMRRENILMVYKGDFSQETVVPILKMIEDNLNKQTEGLLTRKKLYMVLMEALQNISKHAIIGNGKREAIFMISKIEDKYEVGTGNWIDKNTELILKKHLSELNNLSKEELNKLYKKILKEGTVTENGAGLGMIDVARESSEKLSYEFKDGNDGTTFFSLSVQI